MPSTSVTPTGRRGSVPLALQKLLSDPLILRLRQNPLVTHLTQLIQRKTHLIAPQWTHWAYRTLPQILSVPA